jgi:resuscitation-promoting factor RpfA
MTEPRDEELSRIYRDADGPRPPQRVDDNILAASQRVASARPRPAGVRFARRWGTPFALAATVVLTFTLTLIAFERQSDLHTVAPAARRADRLSNVSPAEATRADQPAKPPPEELQSAVAEPAAPSPQAAPRSDGVQQSTVETALSGEHRATGRPARVQQVPRGVEILRKSEEAKPLSDAQRVFDAQQQVPPMQAPPAFAPASGANSLRESASTLQGAGAVSGVASRIAVPEARERTAEKWIEDIRKLKTEGKATEAERELAEFRKRYPDYILPEDLR